MPWRCSTTSSHPCLYWKLQWRYLPLDVDGIWVIGNGQYPYINSSYPYLTFKCKILYGIYTHVTYRLRWNQLDVAIVILSVVGIVLEELKSDIMPINPTIMRVMRVLRIARGK